MTMTGQKLPPALVPKNRLKAILSQFHPPPILYSCKSWIFYLNNNRLKAKMAGKYLNSRG
jgi:hypothetical protein